MSKINNYNSLIQNNHVSSVSDIVNGKELNIHTQIFECALLNFILENSGETGILKDLPEKTIECLKSIYTVIETRGETYTEPSKITIFKKDLSTPEVIKIDLGEKDESGNYKYWPEYKFGHTQRLVLDCNPFNYIGDYDELLYIDYVREEAIIRNKLSSEEKTIPLSNINKYTKISDELSSKNTFYSLIKTWQRK